MKYIDKSHDDVACKQYTPIICFTVILSLKILQFVSSGLQILFLREVTKVRHLRYTIFEALCNRVKPLNQFRSFVCQRNTLLSSFASLLFLR
jgi:hypothetical protein